MQVFSHLIFTASDYLKRQGHDPVDLARQVGIPAAATQSAGEEIALSQQVAFFELAAERCADAHFGLSVGQHRTPGSYGLIEFLARSCATMGEVFERCARYFSILNPASQLRYERQGAEIEVTHDLPGVPGVLGRHGNELTLASITLIARELTGRDWRPRALWFANPAGPDLARLERFFGTSRLSFDAPNNGFRFPAADLELELLRSDPALASYLEMQAREKARALPAADDVVGQVSEAIRRALPDGSPSLERIAVRLELSARTLQRRLDERGTRFAELLEGIRQELAQRYVKERERPASEIAFLLGYSDVTTFLRAFKRWTGKTPSEFRAGS